MKAKKITHFLSFILLSGTSFSQSWSNLGTGIGSSLGEYASTLSVYNNTLFVGGKFATAGGIAANNIAAWDGSFWGSASGGVDPSGFISSLHTFSTELFLAGTFSQAGGSFANSLASFNGSFYNGISLPFSQQGAPIRAMATFSNELYFGRSFMSGSPTFQKWNGGSLVNIPGPDGSINALCVYNNELYAAGSFTSANGVNALNIAKWDGTSWTAVGLGVTGGIPGFASAMQVYNGELYVAGSFTNAGGIPAANIAKWNGSSWTTVGTGANADIACLHVFNSKLYAGGNFTSIGGTNSNRVAEWNGTSWISLGLGTDGSVLGITDFNNELIVAGSFTTAGGVSCNQVAKWNPSAPTGINGLSKESEILVGPNPSGGDLHVILKDIYVPVDMKIYNDAGTLLINKTVSPVKENILKTGLHAGLYLYDFSHYNKVIKTGKLIIE